MKTHSIVLACITAVSSIHASLRIPTPHEPGLLVPSAAIPLAQSDFASGTYRITESGYYYLTEDIAFNPDPIQEKKRTDKPLSEEWFTALSVECDNVIIDLNTKTFYASKEFLDIQLLKLFSLIELSNMPFPNIKREFGFKGEKGAIYANNVTIKNGTIGTSPHHGIHGNNNSNVQLYDLVVSDWEVAGIAFNGLKNGVMKNISISGLEHTFSFTGLISVALIARLLLEQLIAAGDTQAQSYIAPLNVMIADPKQNGSIHPSGLNYGNAYGIFLNRTFDIGPVATTKYEAVRNLKSPLSTNAILIEDVRISNIKIDTLEAVVIGDANGNAIMPELFGSMRWEDAYPDGVFAPDALLKAQVYILNKSNPKAMPEGFAQNILSNNPQESVFTAQARPVFNRDFPIHAQKGIFGIRVDVGTGVTIKNCSVMGLENIGKPGASLADVAAGQNYSFTPGRFTGNDIHGILLAVCDNCSIENCDVSACSSENGNVYGIAVLHNSHANSVEHCKVSGLKSSRDDTVSPINPSASVYGYCVRNGSDSNRFIDCISQHLQSPRSVHGFYIEGCRDTSIAGSLVSNNAATSNQNLTVAKQASGIVSVGSHGTAVRTSVVREMSCPNEKNLIHQSASRAFGYFFGSDGISPDVCGTIEDCVTECNDAGLGIASGIYLDSTLNATVIRTTSVHNTALGKQGFGFYRTKNTKNAFVLSNSAYGNDHKNYESGDVSWPTLTLSSSNVNAMNIYNPWYNISINN
jgi:hypothetical protein